MIIDKLSNSSIKICLDNSDFQKYNIDYTDIDINSIKKFLICISSEISETLGKDITSKGLFVEVFSKKNKCTIFVSLSDDYYNKQKNKKTPDTLICQFDKFCNLESFCYALNALYKNSIKRSVLFCGADKLRLIIELYSEYNNIKYLASGYCVVIMADEINTAVINEYYRKISSENAVEEILLSITK